MTGSRYIATLLAGSVALWVQGMAACSVYTDTSSASVDATAAPVDDAALGGMCVFVTATYQGDPLGPAVDACAKIGKRPASATRAWQGGTGTELRIQCCGTSETPVFKGCTDVVTARDRVDGALRPAMDASSWSDGVASLCTGWGAEVRGTSTPTAGMPNQELALVSCCKLVCHPQMLAYALDAGERGGVEVPSSECPNGEIRNVSVQTERTSFDCCQPEEGSILR